MAKFLLVYTGGSGMASPEVQAQAMAAWGAWFGRLGPALVDPGNPVSEVRTVVPGGSVSPATDGPTGYSIIQADGFDVAVELARGCPVLQNGGSVQVAETFDVM